MYKDRDLINSNPAQNAASGKSAVASVSTYRPDIDGLRAVAVLLVLIFHTGVSPLRGGFVGVDIFFVISGYLITKHIWEELQNKTFSLGRFYERRIRRIFPALAVVVGVVLLSAPFILFPTEIRTTTITAVTALASFSNLYLLLDTWGAGGYFSSDAVSQPLLHTWSLGVEEQFYLAFPLLLAFFGTRSLRAGRIAVVVFGAASFVFCIWFTFYNRDGAYYFPIARAWELACGGILAVFSVPRLPKFVAEIVAAGAAVLLLASGYKFYPGMNFPGYYAAVPVLAATALIAIGGNGGSMVSKLLSTAPFVWVGKISYSLYLWHWPVIVSYLLIRGTQITMIEAAGLVALSVGLAWLSWRFVEQPYRNRALFSNGRLFAHTGGAFAVLCCAAVGLGYMAHSQSTKNDEVSRLASYLAYDDTPVYRRGTCFMIGAINTLGDYDKAKCLSMSDSKPNVLIMGDSHGAHLWYGLSQALPNANVMQATSAGCQPTIGSKGDASCLDLMQMTFRDFLSKNKPDVVVLSARWEDNRIDDLRDTLDFLKGKVGKVVVSGPIVQYERPLPRLLAQIAGGRSDQLLVNGKAPTEEKIDSEMKAAVEAKGDIYVSPYHMLCADDSKPCATTVNGVPLQWDYGHLTAEGSKYVAEAIVKAAAIKLP